MIKFSKKDVKKFFRHNAKLLSVLVAAVVVLAAYPTQFVKAVKIDDGAGFNNTIYTFARGARNILNDAEITVKDSDSVTVTENTIKIERAFKVFVEAYGECHELEMTSGTVKDAIAALGYTLDEHDVVSPSAETALSENLSISFTNIDVLTETHIETIQYKTQKKANFNLKEGTTRKTREGQDGTTKVESVKTFVNGVEVSHEEDRTVINETVNEQIEYGAKSAPANKREWVSELKCDRKIMLDENGVPTKYSKVIRGVASAYCTGTTCSTGVSVKPGYIAVDPSIIPYGTEMYIRTSAGDYIYGYAVAADTGGFIYWGNTIADLYVNSYSEAVNFGRRDVEIYILG